MTVAELIKVLQLMPQDAVVVVENHSEAREMSDQDVHLFENGLTYERADENWEPSEDDYETDMDENPVVSIRTWQ